MPTKKKNNDKKKSISVADILMVIGFVALAFTTFLGSKLLDGNLTGAIINTLLTLLLAALFLWLLCIAKKAQNHRQNWMIAEIIILIVFVAGFIVLTANTRHFVYISDHKADLLDAAKDDRDKIQDLFAAYEEAEKKDISKIKESIKTLPADVKIYADEETQGRLNKWHGEHAIKSGHSYTRKAIKEAAANYESTLNKELLGDDYNKYKEARLKEADDIVSSLEKGGDYDDYYAHSQNISKSNSEIGDKLTEYSKQPLKYNLTYDATSRRLISELLSHDYKGQDLSLPKYFDGNKKTSTGGWILTVGMLIFIMCAYFATTRSRRVTALSGGIFKGKKNFTNDGGIDIC